MDLVVNMDLRIVLLCLGVLSCVQSFQAEIVPPLTPMSFTNAFGPLFNTNLGTYLGVIYPASKWLIRQWIYIISIDDASANLLYIVDPEILGYRYSSTQFYYRVVEHDVVAQFELVLSKWLYIATGMNGGGNAFMDVIYRGGNPLHLTVPSSPQLTTVSVYQGSDDASGFNVRSYTGLLCRRKDLYWRRFRLHT